MTSDLNVSLSDTDIVIQRTGSGLSMKIQANDCATGGTFQMEPARDDAAKTRITHILVGGAGSPGLALDFASQAAIRYSQAGGFFNPDGGQPKAGRRRCVL